MLSRIADSLFWLNRYMERSDCMMRVIRTNYILSFDIGNTNNFSWMDVASTFSHTPEGINPEEVKDTASALKFMITDTKNLNSIKVMITKARENARGVQDNITKEVWEQVNQLYHIVNAPDLDTRLKGARSIELIDLLDQNNTLFYGVTDSTMPRGQGWAFMNLGKYIERCLLTIETAYAHFKKIEHQLDSVQDILFWRNLLLSLSGYELYLKTYTRDQHTMNVVDHVILNKHFPRSLNYSLTRINRYLHDVMEESKMEGSENLQKSFGRICSKVEFADINMIKEMGLPQFLHSLRSELVQFSNQLTRIYFSYA
ncbi:MAG: alpha-E domain-containing protein [Chitinophagaceae bacterium]|nr:alpha-E domain-containing protein [Chitinophagaceae bacterium]